MVIKSSRTMWSKPLLTLYFHCISDAIDLSGALPENKHHLVMNAL